MKTGEARGIYSSVLKSYNEQKFKLSKQREELKERMESTPDGKTRYADEAATLELKYNAVAEKQDEYQNYVNQLVAQWEGKFNSVVAKLKNTLYLTTEIGMARRIDNVDFCILLKYSGIFGQDSDTTLTLDIV